MNEYAADAVRTLERAEEDDNPALRPRLMSEFVGQSEVIRNLSVYIQAARHRGETLDHVLLSGPPGLGKTTIAQIVAAEMGVKLMTTSAPVLSRGGDLASLLMSLDQNGVLFIDEIHRLQPAVEEMLYSAMEDFALDLIIGEGSQARAMRIQLPRFTLVGATTRAGALTTPLRDRFGIPLTLEYYSAAELTQIVRRAAGLMQIEITEEGALEIARRSRGTPRIAGRLLRRVRDFATVDGVSHIDQRVADQNLGHLNIDQRGLDALDRRYLDRIRDHHRGGPVGIETLAAALSESRETLEDVVEPYLLKVGLLFRTSRGRMLPDMDLTPQP